MNDPVILDKELLNNLHQAIGDRVPHIISVYLEEAPRKIQEAQLAAKQQDYTNTRIIVHALKSSSANLGAMRVSQLAAALEQKLLQQDFSNIDQELNTLQQAFDQVRPLFNDIVS